MVKVIAENPERFPAIRKDIRRASASLFSQMRNPDCFPQSSWRIRLLTESGVDL